MILARLDTAYFIFPGFPGLQYARAVCLQKLGRVKEAKAVASIELEQNPENGNAKTLIEALREKEEAASFLD